jgi:hypothetical protein
VVRISILALLVLCAVAEAKGRTVWVGEWEYRFDDRKIAKAKLEELLALREHGLLISDAISRDEVSNLWLHRSKTDFTKWAEWGPAWLAKVKTKLVKDREQLAALEAMAVPVELEPVRAHLAQQWRFFIDREALQAQLLADEHPQVPTGTVGAVDVAICAKQIENVVKTKDRSARIEVIVYSLGNCLNGARDDTYPATAWKKFLKRYKIREKQHTELNGP